MSKGRGRVQEWVMLHLEVCPESGTIGEMAYHFCAENEIKRSNQRSARHSLTRALRNLEKAGLIRRMCVPRQNTFLLTKPPKPEADEHRLHTSYHESGHAVIARARQLPISVVTAVPKGRVGGYVAPVHEPRSVGHGYRYDKRRQQWLKTTNDPELDWAGNKLPPRREVSQHEHESEVLMCIAGGMADAMHSAPKDPEAWRRWEREASGSDIRIARDHRGQIESPKTWEEYAAQTHELLLRFWPMVEAIANALMKRDFLTAGDVDKICTGVVRRQPRTFHRAWVGRRIPSRKT
jgi:hypothetical protein